MRRPSKRVWQILLSGVVVAGTFFFVLPQVADFRQVWAAIVDMTWLEVTTLLVAAAWNIASYLFVTVAVLPGLSYGQAFLVGQSSTAVSVALPAGSVVGIGVTYSMYASMGRSGPEIALSTVLTGLWNTFVKLGLPIVALAALALSGRSNSAQLGLAVLGLGVLAAAIVVFALMLRSSAFSHSVGTVAGSAVSTLRRLVHRVPVVGWGDAAVRFRSQTIDVLRHRWLRLTIATLVSHLSLYVVLLLALRHMDVAAQQVTWAEALAAFAIVRLITVLPITPGGLGIVELALTGALVLAGGPRAPVVAAVLVFRFLTLIVQVVLGGVCYLVWQNRSGGRTAQPDAAVEPDAGVDPNVGVSP